MNLQFEVDEELERKTSEKLINQAFLFDMWLSVMENGVKIEEFFLERNINSIALYGLDAIGEHLKEQLEGSKIEIRYIIEYGFARIDGNQIELDDERLPQVDAVVIALVNEYESVVNNIKKYYPKSKLISAVEVIASLRR